jgi:hypothetical protein
LALRIKLFTLLLRFFGLKYAPLVLKVGGVPAIHRPLCQESQFANSASQQTWCAQQVFWLETAP